MNNYAFIDSQNVHLAIRAQRWEVDWKRFRVYLKEKYHVEKAYLFIGYIKGNNKLYEELQSAGFICIWKPTLVHRNGIIKGNCDAELVLHTMIQYSNFDKAVIVTGDGDFYCLVDYLVDKDKLCALLVPSMYYYSALLKMKNFKKYTKYMNDLKAKIKKAP